METTFYSLLAITIIVLIFAVRLVVERDRLRKKYAPILDAEADAARIRKELESEQQQAKKHFANQSAEQEVKLAAQKHQLSQLQDNYHKSRDIYEKLSKEVSLLEEKLEDISFGLYSPHFDFQASADYKARLEENRDRRRQMVRDGQASHCPVNWEVGGSKKEGTRMVKQYSKVLLRAFNAEVDAALANVSWNNILKMEERLKKAFETINELGSTMQIRLTKSYFDVCLTELRLTHEFQEKKQQEQEEQRQLREQMREEEKAQRELEKAQKEAEDDERRYAKALEKARADAEKASGAKLGELGEKVRLLEQQLAEARAQKERAISQAQLTRSGYVYVISNIGSFGENVFKIGMTRRLDPMDRVKELGDASVPFAFDVHAMVYSEDAPSLEGELHNHFNDKRVNLINERKEFFSVSLDELDAFAQKKKLKLELTKLAEAKEYRETLALRNKTAEPVTAKEEFPEDLPVLA